jgi:membrane fusion protein
MSLFRSEAVEARRGEWLGSILITAPLSRWIWATLAISFRRGPGALLPLGYYTRRETVTGQLVPSAGPPNLSRRPPDFE